MDWFGSEDLQLQLKDVPKFKMAARSAQQIKTNLTNILIKQQNNCKA